MGRGLNIVLVLEVNLFALSLHFAKDAGSYGFQILGHFFNLRTHGAIECLGHLNDVGNGHNRLVNLYFLEEIQLAIFDVLLYRLDGAIS